MTIRVNATTDKLANLSVRIPLELDTAISIQAASRRMSKRELVQQALEDWLKKQN